MLDTPSLPESIPEAIERAMVRLREDGFIAYPTETVWGLGACADRARGVDRLMDWKGRASNAPMAVLVPSASEVVAIRCHRSAPVERLMAAFWPGPLMIIVPCDERWAKGVARADGALGLRCSPHPLAAGLSRAVLGAGLGPLTSTRLNRSGQPPASDSEQAARLVASGGETGSSEALAAPLLISVEDHDATGSKPSTVVDCTGEGFEILRDGAIDSDLIAQAWGG